jgi:hypothetical protein
MSYWEHNITEKRNGPDFYIKWIKTSSYIVWFFLAVFVFLTDLAKPQEATFFDRLLDVSVRTIWDKQLLTYAFIIAITLFTYSLFSLLLNCKRLKRKSDHLNVSLIISTVISAVGILLYIIFFSNTII